MLIENFLTIPGRRYYKKQIEALCSARRQKFNMIPGRTIKFHGSSWMRERNGCPRLLLQWLRMCSM